MSNSDVEENPQAERDASTCSKRVRSGAVGLGGCIMDLKGVEVMDDVVILVGSNFKVYNALWVQVLKSQCLAGSNFEV